MTDFTPVTPFEIARRIALAGEDTPSVYVLIVETGESKDVQADLAAEVQIQLGGDIRRLVASEMHPGELDDAFRREAGCSVVLVEVDRWAPRLVDSIDRNIILLTRAGAVLLLADRRHAERVLNAAPNLRNRLTEVLTIGPDRVFGGAPA